MMVMMMMFIGLFLVRFPFKLSHSVRVVD